MPVIVNCGFCGNQLSLKPSHAKRHENHYCNIECMAQAFCTPITNTCDRCGIPLDNRVNMYCEPCRIEENRERGLRQPRSQTVGRVTLTCPQCGNPFEVRVTAVKHQRTTGKTGERKYCSLACYWESKVGTFHGTLVERTIKNCLHCDAEFEVLPSQIDQIYCSRKCYMGRKTSSIERAVAAELRQRKILYDDHIQMGPFIPDLLVGQTVIEVDGDYWHSLPGIPEKDARKDAFYAEHGFDVIHIWEHEVNAGDFSKLDALVA